MRSQHKGAAREQHRKGIRTPAPWQELIFVLWSSSRMPPSMERAKFGVLSQYQPLPDFYFDFSGTAEQNLLLSLQRNKSNMIVPTVCSVPYTRKHLPGGKRADFCSHHSVPRLPRENFNHQVPGWCGWATPHMYPLLQTNKQHCKNGTEPPGAQQWASDMGKLSWE